MSLIIHGELDAISGDAAGLQAVSDKQAAAMQRMASTLEAAAAALQSPGAGASLQRVGAELHADGLTFSTQFADHSDKMNNNRAGLETGDQDGAADIEAVLSIST